jgi:transketolase
MTDLEKRSINTLRFLAVDAVQKANSGHPGLPMGAAPMAYVLWTRFLKHDPSAPAWPDRDRFVLSGGHGSMLLYALLHLSGYEAMTMEQLKSFRQLGSLTPGHPESHITPGVEATIGPLGQGFSTAVGMALAERFLAATFSREQYPVMDHFTYVIASDGDLMEGVASEAASLAGHLGLGKLVVLYDDNQISLADPTAVSFTEDVTGRFDAYGWQVEEVEDGNQDLEGIHRALDKARSETGRPSLIRVRTTIGFGSPTKAGTSGVHGAPLGPDEVKATKQNLGLPLEPDFLVPDDVREHYREAAGRSGKAREQWKQLMSGYRKKHADLARRWDQCWSGLPEGWERSLPVFKPEEGSVPTRKASGAVINALAPVIPNLIGGSADLEPSTNTYMKGIADQQKDTPEGRNVRFGVREHAMGAAVNGMALHGGLIPFGGTFLTFSDYMRGAVRVSALSRLHTIWVWTHDSVWLGEDGPTHQSVEHLAALRAIPHLTVLRPADANETAQAWKVALTHTRGPVALVCSRQGLPMYDRGSLGGAEGVARGAYVLAEAEGGRPDVILIGTGSEVALAMEARDLLADRGVKVRVVSMPSWELFDAQDRSYRDRVLPPQVKARVAVEAGVSLGWWRFVGDRGRVLSRDDFGKSAPYKVLAKEFGFTPEAVADLARQSMKDAG